MNKLFQVDEQGWLSACEKIPSPNFDARPEMPIELLVIHNISLPPEQFEGDAVIRFFTNQLDCSEHPYYQKIEGARVSAHFFIRRDGHVIQFVSCLDRAWHAGMSLWQGRSRCNDFSIGIELEGSDTTTFTLMQYQSLITLSHSLQQAYPLKGIAGHSHIAPVRKTDPGEFFDWSAYLIGLAGQKSAELS